MNAPPAAYFAYVNDPNIIYLLLLIGVYGLFFELANPGMIVPGLLGFISLLIAVYTFMWLPVDYTSLTLLLIGLVFMVFEAYLPTFGALGFLGVIAFVLGSYSLFDMNQHVYRISIFLILTMAGLSLGFFVLALDLTIRSYKKKIVTGREGIIGAKGIVLSIENNKIKVRVLGEIWNAESTHKLHPDQIIKVTNIKGLVVTVEPYA